MVSATQTLTDKWTPWHGFFWAYEIVVNKVLISSGEGGLSFPYLLPPIPAPFSSGSRLCTFSLAKYYAILRTFFIFLPLGNRAPAFSFPASRRLSPHSSGWLKFSVLHFLAVLCKTTTHQILRCTRT